MRSCCYIFLFISFGLILTTAKSQTSSNPSSDKPNILLILVDDLSWSAITPYGNQYQDMPHLTRLVSEGMRFTDAYVTPQCTPTRASLLTGQHTARNEMWHVIPGYGYPYAKMREPTFRRNLPRGTYTLGKALQDQGYTTALLGKWHLTANDDGHYLYLYDQGKAYYGFDYVNPRQNPENYANSGDKGVQFLTDEAIQFMESSVEDQQPFFVYLSHHSIHTKVYAPDSLVAQYKSQGWPLEKRQIEKVSFPSNAVYLAALKHLDNSVGQLLYAIEQLSIEENTVVIFLSDNGGDDSQFENYPLRYGKGSAYEGGIRVPLIVKYPKLIKRGTASNEPVHVVDIYPTLLDLARGKAKEDHPLDGLSLRPLLTQQGNLNRDALYWYMPLYDAQWGATPSAVIREGSYKLIHFFGDHIDLENGGAYITEAKTVLYNLEKDISETTDLSGEMPERVSEMKDKLLHWIDKMGAELPTLNPDYNPDSALVSKPGGRFKL
ncbi:MAG: sulfatase [Bacteroidota bacterium]